MNPRLASSVFAGIAAAALQQTAHGQVVNADFNSADLSSPTYSGLGVAPGVGTIWNGLGITNNNTAQTFSSLVDSFGVTTSIGLTLQKTGSFDDFFGPQAFNTAAGLMRDYASVDSFNPAVAATRTLVISGLLPSISYDLYLFGAGNEVSQNTIFNVGASTQATTGPSVGTGSLTLGEDYVVFASVTPNGLGEITVTWGNDITDALPSKYGIFNGLQIVAIPEPGTLALAGLGAVGLAFLRRRRA